MDLNRRPDNTEVDVLLAEYRNRFDEVLFHSERYHRQANYIQVYLTAAGALMAALSSGLLVTLHDSGFSEATIDIMEATIIVIAFLVALYLLSSVMDALFCTYANGERLSDIEQQINRSMGSSLMRWDSEIIPRLYSRNRFTDGAWIRPNMLVGAWSFPFVGVVTAVLCFMAYILVEPFFYYFTPVAAFLTSLLMVNWLCLHREGLTFTRWAVAGGERKQSGILSLGLVITLANTFLGYLPMLLFSVRDAAFCESIHEFPFCSLSAVAVGDLLLLPAAAIAVVAFLREHHWRELVIPFAVAFGTSVFVNVVLHVSWVRDDWTGFMDTSLGRLSEAGWIHAVYSTLYMALFGAFIFVLIRTIASRHDTLTKPARRLARIGLTTLSVFTTLGIVDAVSTYYRIGSGSRTLFGSIWPSFVPLAAMLALLSLLAAYARQGSD